MPVGAAGQPSGAGGPVAPDQAAAAAQERGTGWDDYTFYADASFDVSGPANTGWDDFDSAGGLFGPDGTQAPEPVPWAADALSGLVTGESVLLDVDLPGLAGAGLAARRDPNPRRGRVGRRTSAARVPGMPDEIRPADELSATTTVRTPQEWQMPAPFAAAQAQLAQAAQPYQQPQPYQPAQPYQPQSAQPYQQAQPYQPAQPFQSAHPYRSTPAGKPATSTRAATPAPVRPAAAARTVTRPARPAITAGSIGKPGRKQRRSNAQARRRQRTAVRRRSRIGSVVWIIVLIGFLLYLFSGVIESALHIMGH